MPDTNQWRNRAKVLFYGLCTASGVIAPILTADFGLPLEQKLALALGSGALTLLGSWRMNTEVQEHADNTRERLPETNVLLRNHDLNILVIEALRRAIQHAAASPVFAAQKKLIEALAAQVEPHFSDLANGPRDSLSREILPNLALLRLSQTDGGKGTGARDLETWQILVDDLAKRANSPAGFLQLRARLAAQIRDTFDSIVVAVFKEDATGRGPTQGRGWAALTLLFWTRLSSDLRVLKEYAVSQDELMMLLLDIEQRASGRLEELLRWLGPLATEQKELSAWLKEVHGEFLTKLYDVERLIGHGLLSPEEFRLSYWNKRRRDPGLQLLWQDAARAALLTTEVVGRAGEIAEFEQFIHPKNPHWVQIWKGYPGTGKSRLMIEFAERATAAGYRVFFVSHTTHDLIAALRCIESDEPLLLLWDDYHGENADSLRDFLEPQGPPLDPLGPPVKRVITAWPSQNILAEKVNDPFYMHRTLRPITPDDELTTYTCRLVDGLSSEDARRVVQAAAGQPEAVLRAVKRVLDGTRVDQLSPICLKPSTTI